LAIADRLRQGLDLSKHSIVDQLRFAFVEAGHDVREGQLVVEEELREFERRQVVVNSSDCLTCKVPFFERWLREKGVKEIVTTFSDLDAFLDRKREDESLYVHSTEVLTLVKQWGLYKGQQITEDAVRSWLMQFGDMANQRLMFKVLQHIKFYKHDNIRQKMRVGHGIVIRDFWGQAEQGKHKRSDILVSYLDPFGKSGAEYAKRYADENGIFFKNIVETDKISESIRKMQDLKVVVFIDDFVGTGNSTIENFKRLNDEYGALLRDSGLKIYFIAVSGFQSATSRIEQTLQELDLPVVVRICDPLNEADRCFSDESAIFLDVNERLSAKHIAHLHGKKLVKDNPLGYLIEKSGATPL